MTLFRRLLGQAPKPPAEVLDAVAELRNLARQQPALAAPVSTLADVLPILMEDVRSNGAPHIEPEHAQTKWSAGVPLLRGEASPVNPSVFGKRWFSLCDVLGRHVPDAAALARALRNGDLDPIAMIAEALAGQTDGLHARAEALGLDPALTANVLRWALWPTLLNVQERLAPMVAVAAWRHGYCPICGSWPILGEFRGLEQVRFLRCGLCAAAWEFPRLRCPFCDNHDHRQLGYFHRDGEEGKERVATCEECRGYVKMVATFSPLSPVRLLVMEAATLPLDLVAAQRGYAAL